MELKDSLGYLLNVTAKYMKRDLDGRLKKYQITTTQWAVMKVLSQYGELMQAEITARLDSDQATGGAVIERMIKNGLLKKRTHETDRRAYLVSLTDYGSSIVEELETMALDTNERAFLGMCDEEREQFCQTLHRMMNNLKEG